MMHARVTTGEIQPGTMDELIHFYKEVAPQVLKGLNGFVRSQLLTDRAANKVMVVSLYETLADLEAGETSLRQALADPRVAATGIGSPVVAVYEVAVHVTPNR
jgi:heme-degrading monooxygenase HmoA